MSVFRKRGFDAHKNEEQRRKDEAVKRRGNIWRYFLSDDDEDVPVRFLTEEPVLFYEHSIPVPGGGNKFTNETCTGDDCPHCESGNRASYKGAWLVVDGREREVDEYKDNKKTGKKKIIKDQIKMYVRGSTDIAKLDRLSRKFGLTTRPWFATKTGANTSTSYELDRGEKSKLTSKEIQNLIAKLPEKYREHYNGDMESLYDIVEDQVFGDVIEDDEEEETRKPSKNKRKSARYEEEEEEDEDEDDYEDADSGVQSLDDDDEDEEEEEKPRKKLASKKSTKSSVKKPAGKKAAGKKKLFKR
jgi:hypothetical protein